MKTLLLFDEHSVAAASGVMFHLNTATKHPANPVLLPGEPHHWDSLCVSWPGTVLYSPRDRKLRCWYTGMDVVQTKDRTWHTGYAESDDGIEWRKPELEQAEFLGRPTNQLEPAWKPYFLSTAFENPLPDAPPSQQFGGYWTETRFAGEAGNWGKSMWSKSLAWSPDGINWTRASTAYGEKPRAPFLDISQLVHDPADPDPSFRWKAYGQIFVPRPDGSGWPGIRNIGLAHGSDAGRVEDAAKLVVLAPMAGVDEEVHFAAVQKIGDQYVMLFESDRFSKNPIHGDLRLAVSNDGKDFRRVHPQSTLVQTGPKGHWDENLLVTNTAGWLEFGDEIWIFYFGCPNIYNSWPAQYAVAPERRGSWFAPVYLGLATLPRDRFAYATGSGTLTTHSIQIETGELWLNADGADLPVTLLDDSERTVAQGALSGERRHGVYRKVNWPNRIPPGSYRARVGLTNETRLFSLQYQ